MYDQLQNLIDKLDLITSDQATIDPFAPIEIIALEISHEHPLYKDRHPVYKIKLLLNLSEVEEELKFNFNKVGIQLIFSDHRARHYAFQDEVDPLLLQRNIIEFYSLLIDLGGHIFEVHE